LVLGLVLAALLGVGLFTTVGGGHAPGRPNPGDAAPAFSLPRLGGGRPVGIPTDGGAAGHPVVVLFYASDCVPCQGEIPKLATVYRAQEARGTPAVSLIGVAAADPAPAAFARRSGVTFPVGLDDNLDVTQGKYDFSEIPEAVFVNGQGTIVDIHYGALTPAELAVGERSLTS
jgi:thiol-disulfide isomerase/thioredoxin